MEIMIFFFEKTHCNNNNDVSTTTAVGFKSNLNKQTSKTINEAKTVKREETNAPLL